MFFSPPMPVTWVSRGCRLFFLYEGSSKSREVMKLREIKSVTKITQNSFLSNVPAIRIQTTREFVLYESLQ